MVGGTGFTYDAFNRMTEAILPTGEKQANRYDAEGLRAEMEENGRLAGFLFSGRDAVCETDKDGAVVNRLVRGLISTESADAVRYRYHLNERGDTEELVFEAGGVANRYRYGAFGDMIEKEETVPNRCMYAGEQFDGATGQYYLRARFYNPVLGRFLGEDAFRGDGLNLYVYCKNNPVSYVDPTGYTATACGNKDVYKASEEFINPSDIRFSQSSVNNVKVIIESMNKNGWKGEAIDVVRMSDGQLTTVDNSRLLAAHYVGIDVKAIIHEATSPISSEIAVRFQNKYKQLPSTWGEALLNRINGQKTLYKEKNPFGSNFIGWDGK